MQDLKNMQSVSKQIQTDKTITLWVSMLGAVIGAGCVVFAVTVLFN